MQKKKKITSKCTNTSLKRLILIHALADGEQWKYILKTQTGLKMKVWDCMALFECKATLKARRNARSHFCSAKYY